MYIYNEYTVFSFYVMFLVPIRGVFFSDITYQYLYHHILKLSTAPMDYQLQSNLTDVIESDNIKVPFNHIYNSWLNG